MEPRARQGRGHGASEPGTGRRTLRRGTALAVGDVVVDTIEANPPSAHLQELAGKPILAPLVLGGGIRGRIRQGGTIREGDPVRWLTEGSG